MYSQRPRRGIILKTAVILAALCGITFSASQEAQGSFSFNHTFQIYDPVSIYGPGDGGMYNPADSIVFQGDSVFTIEGVKEELKDKGEWIQTTEAEVDPDGVTDGSEGVDDNINTDYIWRPNNVEEGWSPYTNGYWEYTNHGWFWVSYYDWGWRTCHYGRWWWHARWGWVWSPGFYWAPSWVVWMYNDGYCGWYPISPRVRWHHHRGWYCHGMRYRTRCWTFVPKQKFADPITPVVIVDPMHNPGIIKTSEFNGTVTISTAGIKNQGPKIDNIRDATGKHIVEQNVSEYNNIKVVPDPTTKIKDERVNDNSGVKNNTGTKKDDGTRRNDGGYKNNDGTKNNDGIKNNDGTRKNDDNTKRNNDTKNDDSNKRNDGNVKKYTPPPSYDPPKQDPPTYKQDPPKQNPPTQKQDPPKQNPPTQKQDPPKQDTQQDDGNKQDGKRK